MRLRKISSRKAREGFEYLKTIVMEYSRCEPFGRNNPNKGYDYYGFPPIVPLECQNLREAIEKSAPRTATHYVNVEEISTHRSLDEHCGVRHNKGRIPIVYLRRLKGCEER
jgi:hypothetical protein